MWTQHSCGVYFSGVGGTWFNDALAGGAKAHIPDIEHTRPGWPAYNAARQHARADTGSRTVVLAQSAKHGGGAEFFLQDLDMTQFQYNPSNDSGGGMKMKVIK